MAVGSPDFVPRGPVQVMLSFFEPPKDGSLPYQYTAGQQPPTVSAANYGQRSHGVDLTDIRGQEHRYSLDKDAFQALQITFLDIPYDAFLSDSGATVQEAFYTAVEKLLLDSVQGAHRVIIFDHEIRLQNKEKHSKPLFTSIVTWSLIRLSV